MVEFPPGNMTMIANFSRRKSTIALTRILETVVTFHFNGGKVYSMNKG